jgi:GNAT superfamily N-acetyltransferase
MICRPATADDIPFLVDSFVPQFQRQSTHADGLGFEKCARLLTNLLANGWRATVAELEGMIIGWTVHGAAPNRLAWVYVRDMFRGQGVMKALFKAAGTDAARTFESPFLPNRGARRWRIHHRPYECVP